MRRHLLVLGLAGLLAGCGGGGGKATSPQALPPVEAAPRSAATHAPSATSTPAEARTPDGAVTSSAASVAPSTDEAASASDFAREWIAAVNRAYQTLDPAPIVALSDPGCVSCNNNVQQLTRDAGRKVHYRGGTNKVLDVAAPPVQDAATSVVVVLAVDTQEVIDASGRVLKVLPAIKMVSLNVHVHKVQGHWRVIEVTR